MPKITTTPLVYEDLEKFPNDGLRREIIGGELFVTPSPEQPHQRAVLNIAIVLREYEHKFGGQVTIAPFDVVLSAQNVVEPDVVFVAADRIDVSGRKAIHGAPTVAVEVLSPSTSRVDRVKKRELYARFAVPEYWIVDTDERTIERCSDPQNGVYQTIVTFDREFTSEALPGFRSALDELFS